MGQGSETAEEPYYSCHALISRDTYEPCGAAGQADPGAKPEDLVLPSPPPAKSYVTHLYSLGFNFHLSSKKVAQEVPGTKSA